MSTKRTGIQKVSLEKISNEKLPRQIVKYISEIDLEIWVRVEPGFKLTINKNNINCWLMVSTSTKKAFAWVGGTISSLLIIAKVLHWFIPVLQTYYIKNFFP
jgi:hypothetical protein